MNDCQKFRSQLGETLRLSQRLRRWPDHGLTGDGLSWHEHLSGCGECRELLTEEHALDELLEVLRDARAELPSGLAARVLARLRVSRALDGLLDGVEQPVAPEGLAARVLEGLSGQRDALDRVLGRAPEPIVPADLGQELLRSLRLARRRPRVRRRTAALAAAALLFVSLAVWRFAVARPESPIEVARTEDESVSDELLLALDVLERWDEISGEDLDVLLAQVDATDEAYLTLDGEIR